jgi:acyl carrier protein
MALTREVLLKFLEDNLGVDTTEVDQETPLFSSGLIDSASMVDLIVFVESEGNVKFGPDDITLDYLDSVARILGFVARQHELE